MSSNLTKLNLFYKAIDKQTFEQEIPNVSTEPIEKSFNIKYIFPLYNSCDNTKIGIANVVENDVTFDNQTRILSTFSQTFLLPNGTLTFNYNTNTPNNNSQFLPSDKPIELSFDYGTGEYYKANVLYASIIVLEDVERTRIVEIIIQN